MDCWWTVNRHVLKTVINRQPARLLSTAIPEPHLEGENKQYQPKIVQLVDDISKLTLVEVADLNELLKKSLNIKDAPVMAMGMATAAPKAEEEEETEVKREKTIFTVKLTKYDESKKIQLIKAIKALLPDMNLVQAKKYVESLPQIVQDEISKEDSEKLKSELESAGGTVEVE
ncbi:hypothetical protein LOTGIDRAFT_156500 [Lottia gigantea]|uniref:Large ribosomal subunit protein bL12m n=1 Tax=Lottia gigantea TaxID=225164 RepID=V4B0X6_LOTGI|nr:hypothetical protein LOTGIDRAFT_156500 [Lottia gigantea]ESP03903.1 hypothetical protein LOTGIDRAFT_156500 [Lottia gigantea]